MFKYLTHTEIQKMSFDWRYTGATKFKLFTEDECDVINEELEKLR